MYLNVIYLFSEIIVTWNEQSYLWATFNPKSRQKVSKRANIAYFSYLTSWAWSNHIYKAIESEYLIDNIQYYLKWVEYSLFSHEKGIKFQIIWPLIGKTSSFY